MFVEVFKEKKISSETGNDQTFMSNEIQINDFNYLLNIKIEFITTASLRIYLFFKIKQSRQIKDENNLFNLLKSMFGTFLKRCFKIPTILCHFVRSIILVDIFRSFWYDKYIKTISVFQSKS